MSETVARLPYVHRVVPNTPRELPAFLKGEVQLLQRAGAKISIHTESAAYTISGNDETVLMDTTAGPLSATLPRAAESLNLKVTVKNIGANTLTIVGTVDASANPTLAQWKAMTIACDGVAFFKIGEVL